jgi:DeoR family transcriptional regulator of aga operon
MTATSQRRQRILQLLLEHGNVQVSELSPSFNVSTVTIRNDLSFFEEQGLVTRT